MRVRDDTESTTLAVAHGFVKTAWRGGWSVRGRTGQTSGLPGRYGRLWQVVWGRVWVGLLFKSGLWPSRLRCCLERAGERMKNRTSVRTYRRTSSAPHARVRRWPWVDG